MDIIVIIILFVCTTVLFPILFGLAELKMVSLKAVMEVEDDKITIRKLAIERLLGSKGITVSSASIVRIQFASNPIRGTCVTLFNKSNGAIDFWITKDLEKAVKNQLENTCSHAKFDEV